MNSSEYEKQTIEKIIKWAENNTLVRAVLLTSSRTNPHSPLDILSDFDVILAVTDIHPFFNDRDWLEDFGKVLVLYRDPIKLDYGFERFAYITQYENGSKIDFTLWPTDIINRVSKDANLPDYLDIGYKVLLDKDNLTDGLKPPTYKAYIPTPPTESEYAVMIEEFFQGCTYMAKYLWRDDLMAAKVIFHGLKSNDLRTMLELQMEIGNNWTVKPGAYGRGLKKLVRPEIWSKLEDTYVGAKIKDNWDALFATIDLFRESAIEVASHLGYKYPNDLDKRVIEYLQNVKHLDHNNPHFPF